MSKISVLLFFLSGGLPYAQAQMWNGQDTLYGNEWIDYSKTYYKIPVAQDGMYKISYEALLQSGLSLDDLSGSRFQLFHMGEETPLYVSTEGPLSTGDYLLFYGEKNRGELDRHLFQNPDDEMLNPQYSMFTDTAVYYLTWAAAGTQVRRYQDREMDFSDPPAREAYFMDRARVVFGDHHSKTYFRIGGETLYWSNFTPVEGFGSAGWRDLYTPLTLPNKHRKNFDVELPGLARQVADGALRIRFGCGPGAHEQILQVDGQIYSQFKFSGFQVKDTVITLPTVALEDKLSVQLEGQAIADESTYDGQTVAFAEVSYPRNFNFQNQPVFFFNLPASLNRRYLEITRFDVTGEEKPVLYDLTNGLRYEAAHENGTVKVLLPASSGERHYCLLNEQRGARTVATLIPVDFINYDEQKGDYIILSHHALFDDGAGGKPVQEYANYRSESGYRPVVIDVSQLYEQFAYGLQRHPLAVRNFANYVKRNWIDVKYFFILGKAREYPDMRTSQQIADNLEKYFFVPSFGYYASDNLLLSNNETSVPVIPVGRVPVVNAQDIRTYLKKVKALEANDNNPQTVEGRSWMKLIMHLGGGTDPGERASIQNGLKSMERIIEENKFGAEVTSFYKTSTQELEVALADRIFNTINEGLSILTFFGHSSPGHFDFSIEQPDRYQNYGKYPLILSLGCLSGNVFFNERSIGERFILDYGDEGAVAFGATRGYGYIHSLAPFARQFYQQIGGEYYGRGIGDALRATLATYDHIEDLAYKPLVQQFNLNGDPAIRLHPAPGPDYTIDARSVRFFPKVVSTQLDSFTLSFKVANLGRYQKDSLDISIQQELPSGRIENIDLVRVATPAFSDTVAVKIPGRGASSVGQNTFFLTVDPNNELAEAPESAELNNELKRTLLIIDNTARPVYPPDFGIVGSTSTILKASTTNALAEQQTYIFELDTTALFNSPLKLRKEIIQSGGVLRWPLDQENLDFKPEEVYYWRVSPDSAATGLGYAWENSSFTYIPEVANGWSQGHYWQWLAGERKGIKFDSTDRSFAFEAELINVSIKNRLPQENNRPGLFYNLDEAASSVKPWDHLDEGLAVVVSDPVTASFWRNQSGSVPFEPGDYGITTKNSRVFAFPTSSREERADFIEFIEEVVPDGHYVFVFTIAKTETANLYAREWAADSLDLNKNIFSVLEKEGAQLVRLLDNEEDAGLYILMYQKGEGVLNEQIDLSIYGQVDADVNIPRVLTQGSYFSPLIGPVRQWNSLQWNREGDTSQTGQANVKVYGVGANLTPELLLDSIEAQHTSLDFISSQEYPYLLLEFSAADESERKPPPFDSWRVLFKGLPDAALNPALLLEPSRDTSQQGESIRFATIVENISAYDMDSLLVHFTLTDEQNTETKIPRRLPPLKAGKQLELSLPLDTKDLDGLQSLIIEVNPERDQPELYTFNNLMIWDLFVERDVKNPILDVAFDGNRIMNGDLVSPYPLITILLEDENKYLALNDTSLFNVAIVYPDGRQVQFSDIAENIVFTHDDRNGKNRAALEFSANFEQNGTYQLVVEAKDRSGNIAGANIYRVTFEVITEKAISNIVNYPNPFSTSTQFVYTITGAVPTYLKIQIMTVSGRVVKEIDQTELGALQVGTHRSDYVWDGTDDYGNRLANGVYLYRVIAKDEEGKDYEHYDNGTDVFFKRGLGKLVILR